MDKIFDSMKKSYNDYVSGKFICDRCKQERPIYRSVILPQRASSKLIRVCEHCHWEIYKELKEKNK